MQIVTKSLFKLHLVVFIYGFTAILGKLITLDAIQLVWYRMLIAFLALGVLLQMRGRKLSVDRKTVVQLIGIGFVVAFHWITFFHAIKISTISVALGCLASTTLFTSLLEPALVRRPLVWIEVVTGVLIIAGLYMIFQFEPDYITGIITALISAFLAGLFTVLNKVMIARHRPLVISFYEMGGGFAGITLYMLFSGTFEAGLQLPVWSDWLFLLLLGVVCTAYAFAESVKVMDVLSAYTVVLTINLEPIYGILLAFVFFGESELMSGGFYLGTLTILAAVFLFPVLNRKFIKKRKAPKMPRD
ncbi:DMT family transporter [Marinilabilia salmonicolor]|jgi:drug/metabolite transporter (DMT)-like permease|uniref:Threonine/homoserine efflux transporter RhtA n=1 Tax=Marinilabilia salmonicolor TaxID=989 RepID=A0A2T0XH84_9BACT|nr:DMT family transporter [Marinilabilia salmonicolor]PRY98313.1 threonine/homoserine efflux transporter RhtA [Marinilabilia salmonicolor]RCW33887.1 threonine/homoserine efflux transporter RhtA [Marinilabilia salmonicolor]